MLIIKLLNKNKLIKMLFMSIVIFISVLLIGKFNKSNTPHYYKTDNSMDIISGESLINEIKNTNKLIPLEVELSKIITIDKSIGNLEILEKYKRINFFANCSYYIDLSIINDEDLKISKEDSTLDISIPKPEVFTITILRDKTIYEDTSNGLLRFGDIKFTSEEFDLIQENIYESFKETLQDEEIYNKAISNSKISITNLLEHLTANQFKINVSFK